MSRPRSRSMVGWGSGPAARSPQDTTASGAAAVMSARTARSAGRLACTSEMTAIRTVYFLCWPGRLGRGLLCLCLSIGAGSGWLADAAGAPVDQQVRVGGRRVIIVRGIPGGRIACSWQLAQGRGQLALAGVLAGQAASGLVEEWLSDSWHTRGHGLVALTCSKLATTAAGSRTAQPYSICGGCLELTPPGTGERCHRAACGQRAEKWSVRLGLYRSGPGAGGVRDHQRLG